ncbi:MAG: HEPN domain-containing protein [Nitrospirae bacterium]|nr:MAG: HEPN domain-containing protein [Nitrospirota bacterium]
MSRDKCRHEAERWLQTAEEDVATAELLLREGRYAHACFHAQQAGEKAVQALWYFIDADPWGHSIQRLVKEFPRREALPDADRWLEQGALLDKFYIPTRYPNGLPDLTPGEAYREAEGRLGLATAKELVAACRAWLESH